MKSSRWMSRALCAAAPLVFVGCMYPGPYTYGTYPGYGGPPPGYAPPPGGTIVTPGPGFPSPQLGPSTAPPQNWQPTPALTPSPQPSLGPPSTPPSTFNEGPAPFNSGARKPGNIPVPDPLDRDSGPALDPARPDPRPSSSNTNRPFGGDGSQETFGKGAQITIPQRTEVAVQSVGTVDPQTFESPIENERHDRDRLIPVTAKTGTDGRVIHGNDPCAYDRDKYSWLRGIVEFDSHDKAWHIMYSQRPDPHDRYGGDIRLIDHRKLSTFRSGDVVYVEGRIDTHHVDSRGKPQYRIEGDQIERIVPGRPAMQSMGN
jgi:hypothetical protein